MANFSNAQKMQKESSVDMRLPYSVHVTPTTIMTDNRDFFQVLKVQGVSFESADDDQLNNLHERLNNLFISIAGKDVAIYQHIVRREDYTYPAGDFAPGFAHDLNAKYAERISDAGLMVNELYLTVIVRTCTAAPSSILMGLITAENKQALNEERKEALEKLNKIVGQVQASLTHYDTRKLTTYMHLDMICSEPCEFLAYLLNGRWQRIALAEAPLKLLIASTRLFFGNETIEFRGAATSTYGAMLGINAYPRNTKSEFLDDLLSAPFQFILAQSFCFFRQDAAMRKMATTTNQMENSGDAARSQIDELPGAMDALVSRLHVMGEHSFGLLVQGGTHKELASNIALAQSILSDKNIIVAREDLALEAYWGIFPCNFGYRPRSAPINSRNLCGFAPMHNFPMGQAGGNHWGPAVTMFITSAGTPFFFSFHVKDVGHTLVLGPTGSGKTALLMFLFCMLQKMGVTFILFSVNRDSEIAIRANGGTYHLIREGIPTGWNPFALSHEDGKLTDPGVVAYLRMLVKRLVSRPKMTESGIEIDSTPLTAKQEKIINSAIDSVLSIKDKKQRRLGRVMDFLFKGDATLYEHLSKWCYRRQADKEDGANAWVFDSPTDTLADSLGDAQITGFDITEFLDNPELRTPINMHLFFLANRLIDGRRIAIFMSEFWKPLGDSQFSAFIKEMLKTLRFRNGIILLDSQQPSDALNSPISRTLIEQTATRLLLPNDRANRDDYMEGGMDLSEREFKLIKTDMPQNQGFFLLKQGSKSVVLQLPLHGFDNELAVLSARKTNLAELDKAIAMYGEDPAAWLPPFYANRSST